MKAKEKTIKNLILDVDGVLTTGQFLYTKDGKLAKIFGPHDNDGIKLISKLINVCAISADKRGFKITEKRVAIDMGLKLNLVSEATRLSWLEENFDLSESAYVGDGIYDAMIFEHVAYSIAPANAFYLARNKADFVTSAKSGEGAVAEACLHLMEKFLEVPHNLKNILQ
ncbi:MAG TPA: phosphatase [Candidatus Yonathbacteria bacterium]|nr:phosphatase [Candidatus Yonathbacteria bacterium]